MMIIDRCMDYHKISHGLPLIPKYAPTSLSLILEIVLDHARKTLDNMLVKVERADVLGYIVTDPGWLQDNLLCLISNAIRFSSPRSPVLIRIIKEVSSPPVIAQQMPRKEIIMVDRESCPLLQEKIFNRDLTKSKLDEQNDKSNNESNSISRDIEEGHDTCPPEPILPPPLDNNQQQPSSFNSLAISSSGAYSQGAEETGPQIESNSNSQPALRTIRFEVEDFGLGISDLLLPTLFLPPEGPAPSQHNAHDRDALHQQESNKSNNYNDYPPNSQHQEILPHEDQRGNVGGAGLGLYCLAERVKALQGDFGVIRKDKPSQFPHIIQLQDLHKQPLNEEREQREGGEIKEGEDQQQEETKTLEQAPNSAHHHPVSSRPSSNDAKGCIFWFSLPLNRKLGPDLERDSSLIKRSTDSVHLSSPGSFLGHTSFDLGDEITVHEINDEEESEQSNSTDKQQAPQQQTDSFMAASSGQRYQQREYADPLQTRLFRPDSKVSFLSDRLSVSSQALSLGKASSSSRSDSVENTIISSRANREDAQLPPLKIPTASAQSQSQSQESVNSKRPARAPSALATTPRIPSLRAPSAIGSNASSNSFIDTRMDQAVIHLLNNLHLRVMILDDSPLILKMLKMMFLSKGHEVVTTTNGIEALAILKQSFEMQVQNERKVTQEVTKKEEEEKIEQKDNVREEEKNQKAGFDAIFVDIQMPIMDGLQFMREYHKMAEAIMKKDRERKGQEGQEEKEREQPHSELQFTRETIAPEKTTQRRDRREEKKYVHPEQQTSTSHHGDDVGEKEEDRQAAREQKASDRSLPLVVAMSANTDHITMQDSYAAGADHFLQKPFNLDTFYAVFLKHRKKSPLNGRKE
eukprot:scaffold3475_cov173-Ochromonas_danica.AAC.3